MDNLSWWPLLWMRNNLNQRNCFRLWRHNWLFPSSTNKSQQNSVSLKYLAQDRNMTSIDSAMEDSSSTEDISELKKVRVVFWPSWIPDDCDNIHCVSPTSVHLSPTNQQLTRIYKNCGSLYYGMKRLGCWNVCIGLYGPVAQNHYFQVSKLPRKSQFHIKSFVKLKQ